MEGRIQPGANPQLQRPNLCQIIFDQMEGILEAANSTPESPGVTSIPKLPEILRKSMGATTMDDRTDVIYVIFPANLDAVCRSIVQKHTKREISKLLGDVSGQGSPGKQVDRPAKAKTDNQV